MEFLTTTIMVFFFIAIVAGCVDAIAGGGGLITIPAMLLSGMPPAAAIATNKLGGVAGTFSATLHFLRTGHIDPRKVLAMVPATFVGAVLGGLVLTKIDSSFLRLIVPVLLIGFSAYFLFSPNIGSLDKKALIKPAVFFLCVAPLIGFYDGFFGPGTGTFFCLALVLLLGFNMIKATAHAKLLNFSSNLAALIFFMGKGIIVWDVGLAMMAGQFIGGHIGARVAVKHGKRLITITMVVMAVAISLKIMLGR